MLEQITGENLQQMMARFSTAELENMVEKFPYFQQAHLLLAKKYQQESNPKFDRQLQLAALYIQDRELLFTIFNDSEKKSGQAQKNAWLPEPTVEPAKEQVQEEISAKTEEPLVGLNEVEQEVKVENIVLPEPVSIELKASATEEEEIVLEVEPLVVEETSVEEAVIKITEAPVTEEKEAEPFSYNAPHTFDVWLKAFNKLPGADKLEAPIAEPTDEDLDNLIKQNVSVDYLHELVKEETQYAKGLDRFIEEQIQKHKQNEARKAPAESELAPEMITETMAKVYEMQKKYGKAIKAYQILTLKFPEKSSLFAARINYLKNIT